MEFLTYIEDMNRRRELAVKVGSDPDYLWQVGTGRRRCSHELAKKIEKQTGGLVTRYQLRPDIFGEAPEKQADRAA